MRIATQTTDVYTFDELDDSARQTALEKLYDINTDYEWWDGTTEDAKEIGKLLGMDIDNIYFSGFASQGDGACFTGSYEYRNGAAKAIREHAPLDKELHSIADTLQEIQRRNFYKLSARVKQSGHYSHEYCTDIRVYRETEYSLVGDVDAETDEAICEALRGYMRWIYRRLETEYYWLASEEQIIETIRANEYEFTQDGSLY